MIYGREPAFWIGVIVSCILAVLTTLLGQGVISDALAGKLTDSVNAIAQLLTLLAPIIAGLLIRQQVTPTSSPSLPTGTSLTVTTTGQVDKQVTV